MKMITEELLDGITFELDRELEADIYCWLMSVFCFLIIRYKVQKRDNRYYVDIFYTDKERRGIRRGLLSLFVRHFDYFDRIFFEGERYEKYTEFTVIMDNHCCYLRFYNCEQQE